jgi:hypothetical protein
MSGSLTWADGDTAPKAITVTPLDDAADEGNESFFTLANPSGGATLGAVTTATVSITDDDNAPPSGGGGGGGGGASLTHALSSRTGGGSTTRRDRRSHWVGRRTPSTRNSWPSRPLQWRTTPKPRATESGGTSGEHHGTG